MPDIDALIHRWQAGDQRAAEALYNQFREQVYRLRLQILMGQTAGLKKYRALRKDKARVLTVLRERELVSQAGKG